MPNITLKNVPEEVHRRLKKHRSTNSEAIWILERALCPTARAVRRHDEEWVAPLCTRQNSHDTSIFRHRSF